MKTSATPNSKFNFRVISKEEQRSIVAAFNRLDDLLSELDTALDEVVQACDGAELTVQAHYEEEGNECPDDEPLIELFSTIRAACEGLQPDNPLDITIEDGKVELREWRERVDASVF
jgi:hypothetical protein